MYQSFVSLKYALVAGVFLTLSIAAPSLAHTPRGSNGQNQGSEIAPPGRPTLVPRIPSLRVNRDREIILDPRFTPRFNQDIAKILQDLRSGNQTQIAIADILQTPGELYRYYEVVGELRATISQPAVPPNEPGIEIESPGIVRLDLKRQGSMPGSIAARFSRYIDRLSTQSGEFRIFGNDRRGVSRDIQVKIQPRLDGQVELRFTSTSQAMKDAAGNPITETILAPSPKAASVLAGLLPALDVANASLPTIRAAINMVLSLDNVSLSSIEVQQLAQGLAETLLASEALFAGCGKDTSALTCTNLNVNALRVAIEAYNNLVKGANRDTLLALAKNSEFRTLGDTLRRARASISSVAANP